jgi:hypothetical protein
MDANHDSFAYYARVEEAVFWSDRERVKTLIDLYNSYDCLWDIRSKDYKNTMKKKIAKINVGKHFGLSGGWNLLWQSYAC